MSSDRKINYSLRPSKSIERRMLLEVFKEICTPNRVKEYQYIGFGSTFFTDFKILHRNLNILEMTNIELNSDPKNISRLEFNQPYKCIDLKFGHSNDVLPGLNWNKKSIVWLDYDKSLQPYMLEDVETCCSNLKPGSILVISLRREFDQQSLEEFNETFSDDVPSSMTLEDIQPKNSYKTIRKVIINKITSILSSRYATDEDDDKMMNRQIFNFVYEDFAKMYTLGFIFYLNKDESVINDYKFQQYEYITKEEEAISISVPIITNKEFLELNKHLPNTKEAFLGITSLNFIPDKHKENYFNTYRFYPSYIEIRDF